jgi:hypothetical protein
MTATGIMLGIPWGGPLALSGRARPLNVLAAAMGIEAVADSASCRAGTTVVATGRHDVKFFALPQGESRSVSGSPQLSLVMSMAGPVRRGAWLHPDGERVSTSVDRTRLTRSNTCQTESRAMVLRGWRLMPDRHGRAFMRVWPGLEQKASAGAAADGCPPDRITMTSLLKFFHRADSAALVLIPAFVRPLRGARESSRTGAAR